MNFIIQGGFKNFQRINIFFKKQCFIAIHLIEVTGEHHFRKLVINYLGGIMQLF